ncbi:ROK family transcriptional regulator [Agromyces indicus]|uniref:ROK family transcriptional regulator n=1 Tax=Agromyces indicus TaxID=758919 RepID=A0ABU1FFS1_9MICO|nr:ROK family transcriptional regulator [Agromyces indicus]MDR5690594.1 ROK family transcriptional regulator [Agromyces indicus]
MRQSDSAPQQEPAGKRGQTGFRQANVKRVLDALRVGGPASQAALARTTGLSPSTINAIVRSLRDQELIESRSLNGRESVVALVARRGAVVALHVGATELHAALFDFERERRVDRRRAVIDDLSAAGPGMAAALVRELVAESELELSQVDVVGVAMQAPIARNAGTVASWAAAQLPGWRDAVIRDELSRSLEVEVVVDNDANCAGLAEWTWGAGRGSDDFFYVLGSSHVGGAFILNGSVYRGGDGLAGEIGHMVVDPAGPICVCGSRGCLTMYASEPAMLAALTSSNGDMRSMTDIIAASRDGDLAARGVLYDVGRLLGRALANVGKMMAPEVIVIGGELRTAGRPLFESLGSAVEVASLRAVSPTIEFRPAELTADVVLLGALVAGLEHRETPLSELPDWTRRDLIA